MKITYDEDADAMYIYLNRRKIARTVRVSSRVNVDLDKQGNLRGVEILFASKALRGTDFSDIQLQLPKIGEVKVKLPVAAGHH